MPLSDKFGALALPLIGSPMFIISSPELVLAQSRAGIVGTMPSLNVRDAEMLEPTLSALADQLSGAPYGVNLISNRTNERLDHDLEVCVRLRVPLIITSLGPSAAIVDKVHAYGGLVFHDVINVRHAMKAAQAGVDGLIAVCAGAGGHGGTVSPFALCSEIRSVFDGAVVLGGAISTGGDIAAARAMGADFAYMGTRFIATQEANATMQQKQMLVECGASDVLHTPFFTGVAGNYLRPSIAASGLDPDALGARAVDGIRVTSDGAKPKAWKDVWSAGHGVGAIQDIPSVNALVARLRAEYRAACERTVWTSI
jgi:nitronate monooxygenase